MITLLGADEQYITMIDEILENGDELTTRNSITTRSVLLEAVFETTPLIISRKTAWKSALREMEWFLSGSNNINDLHESVRHWWSPWAQAGGTLPHNYGTQFRKWTDWSWDPSNPGKEALTGFDQIEYLIESVRDHPFSRRAVISTWNTAEMASGACNPTNCHGTTIQAFVNKDFELHLYMYQRSADMICGQPHNWIQYWAFLLWLAKQTGRVPAKLTWKGGDCHIYAEHYDLANEICKVYGDSDYYPITQRPQLVYNGAVGDPFRANDFFLDKLYTPLLITKAKMVI